MSHHKLFVIADVPSEIAQEFIQHVRSFDVAHRGCVFEIGIDGPQRSLVEMLEMLRVEPCLTFQGIWERERGKKNN